MSMQSDLSSQTVLYYQHMLPYVLYVFALLHNSRSGLRDSELDRWPSLLFGFNQRTSFIRIRTTQPVLATFGMATVFILGGGLRSNLRHRTPHQNKSAAMKALPRYSIEH